MKARRASHGNLGVVIGIGHGHRDGSIGAAAREHSHGQGVLAVWNGQRGGEGKAPGLLASERVDTAGGGRADSVALAD